MLESSNFARMKGTVLEFKSQPQATDLTVDAAKAIFAHFNDNEAIGILMFRNSVETIEPLIEKKAIDRESLLNRLHTISPKAGQALRFHRQQQ
jgi:hypothetical protein